MTDTALFSVDVDARIIRGLLLPFDELSETSMNGVEPVMFSASTDLALPADPMAAPLFASDHDRFSGVGHAVELERTEAGIVAKFSIAKTPEGDELLKRAADDTQPKPKLSAEIAKLVRRGKDAVSGVLTGASIVTKGAFASAGLFSAAGDVTEESSFTSSSSDGSEYESKTTTEETEEDLGDGRIRRTRTTTTVTTETATPAVEAVATDSLVASAASTDAAPAAPTKEDAVAEATVPNTLQAGAADQAPAAITLRELDAMFAAKGARSFSVAQMRERLQDENSNEDALFALNQVKFDGAGGMTPTVTPAPQWMDEVWNLGVAGFKQTILPLFGHKDLTQLQLAGWKWTTAPAGGDFAGNGGAVPSNTLAVAAVTGSASRYAVGHSFARELIDFPQPGFFESYAAAVTRDYLKWADGKVATTIVAGATALAADLLATIPGNPAATATNPGGTIGNVMSAIIDGATVIVSNGVLPEFALINPTDWKKIAKLPKTNVLGYLNAALGLPEGSMDGAGFILRPSAAVTAGKVLVGVGAAATVYELPGVPVRIDALNVAQGNADQAAFGYCGTVINDATGLQLVTIATT